MNTPLAHDDALTLVDSPTASEVDTIFAVIRSYNDAHIEVWQPERFAIFIRDQAGQLRGGVYVVCARGWMYLDGLAVAEDERRRGLGSRLLNAAEYEARRRGCHHAWLETYSFQARPFYERHGYQVFGALDDYPHGHQRYFMHKALAAEV